ncbi:MAG: NfeD family protein [Prochloraceae cyanobacterium]
MLSPTFLWLIAGSILCLMEFLFPTAFVAFMMGISALLVALVSLVVPSIPLQIVLWLVFSCLLIILSRQLFTPQRQGASLGEDREGETLTEIPPGKTGRVIYEGNSWRAKCENEYQAIAADEKVYVVRRQGNTLIVLPQKLLDS